MRWLLLTAALLLHASSTWAGEGFVCAGTSAAPRDRLREDVAAKVAGSSTEGTGNAIVLFAKFRGELPAQTAVPAWAEGIFDPDRPGSLSHFCDTMSFGKLRAGDVYRVPLSRREFFLLEYRTSTSTHYDRHLPAAGVLIGHTDGSDVDLECADGRWADKGYPLGEHGDSRHGAENLDFWAHDRGYAQAHAGNLGDATDPFDASRLRSFTPEFIQRLNEAAGETVYRLPTEAEWEYARRAGTTTRWSFGDDEAQLVDHGWYRANAWNAGEQYAHAVGARLPNPWGLRDMHGNVRECCRDWFDSDYYGTSPTADPPGPTSGSARVVRGGDFSDGAP